MNVIYILKASAITAVLWLVYRLLLRKDTFFDLKRLYFIAGIFLSFLLPMWHLKKIMPVDTASIPIPVNNLLSGNLQEVNLQQGIDLNYLLYILLAGTVIFLVKMLIDFTGIYRLITGGIKEEKTGYVLVSVDKDIPPFSFGRYVVVNPKQYTTDELQMILAHETVHIRQKHSIDVVLAGIFTALQWYNPFVWLWRNDMIENLEFIADNQAANKVESIKNYQYLLLKTGLTNPIPALVNNFYKPNLKNRIMMLQKQQTKSIQLVKFGILLPLIALFLYGFNTDKVYAKNAKTLYTIDKNTTSKELDKIEKQINDESTTFKVHFDNIWYVDNKLVNLDVVTHYRETGNDTRLQIQDKKGILETVLYIQDNMLVVSQNKKTFSMSDNGIDLLTFDNKSYDMTSTQVKHYNKDGKEDSQNLKTGMVQYQNTTYFYTKTGKNYHFFDRYGTEVDKKTADALLQKLTGGQVFIIDNSIKYKNDTKPQPLYVLNGKIISKADFDKINPKTISKITVLKADAALKKYGDKGKNGVVELFTK